MQWLQRLPEWLARHGALMLVSLIPREGFSSCEQGEAMLVAAHGCCGSLGGAHLEWEAMAIARALLEQGLRKRQTRFVLGPGAGAVRLLFERIDADKALLWRGRAEAVARGSHLLRVCSDGDEESEWQLTLDAQCSE